MIGPRARKVLGDLRLRPGRTMLVVVTLVIGLFAFGSVLGARAILTREIGRSFAATAPPGATLRFEEGAAPADLRARAATVPGVTATALRGVLDGRVRVGPDEWRRALVFVVDFGANDVATFRPESGAFPPPDGEVLLERSGAAFLGGALSGGIDLALAGSAPRRTGVAGIVHDGAQSPGWMDGIGYVYLSRATAAAFGVPLPAEDLLLRIAPGFDRAAVAAQVAALVPGAAPTIELQQGTHHPHADQMESLLFLFGAFGALAFLLAVFLTATSVGAIVRAEEVALGTLKALGATRLQILGMYAQGVVVLGAAALAIALPLAHLGAGAYARFVARVLNVDLVSQAFPGHVDLVLGVAGLVVPPLAALGPLLGATGARVRDALTRSHTLAPPTTSPSTWRWGRLSTRLALAGALRERGRLLANVLVLALGGATFLAAWNVSASWRATVDGIFTARRYDLQVVLAAPTTDAALAAALADVPGLRAVEPWTLAWARKAAPAGAGYRMLVTGVPPETSMVAYPLLAGRWLRPDDTDAVVVNHELALDPAAGVHLGATLPLVLGGTTRSFRVVGVVRELGARRRGQNVPAAAYVPRRVLAGHLGEAELTNAFVVTASTADDPAQEAALAKGVERALDRAGLARTIVQPRSHRRRELLDHLVVIRDFLLAMAAFVGTVGGLALGAAMSVAVVERSAEIAVLRALGATARWIAGHFAVEGVLVALASVLVAQVFAIPLGRAIGDEAGRVFVHAPLDQVLAPAGALIWLLAALAIGAAASAIPALARTRASVAAELRAP